MSNRKEEPRRILTGTNGLDELLQFDARYWSCPHHIQQQHSRRPGLEEGTTTLLVGPPGTGKSILCYQFLFAEILFGKGNVLYISFDRDHEQVERALKAHWNRLSTNQELLGERLQYLVFRQSQVNFNMLAAQIRSAIEGDKPKRIAIDGLSEWLTACEPIDSNFLLEALHFTVKEACSDVEKREAKIDRNKNRKLTQFLAYESPDARQLTPRALGIPAENIVVLDKIGIHDASRKMIYVLKAARQQIDSSVREVVFDERGLLRIDPGFDAYTGLLDRQPRPAMVLLQLFEENKPERLFNEWARKQLGKLRNLQFTPLTFFRSEIGRTLEELDLRRDVPPSALRILSVDEWWLRKRIGLASGAASGDGEIVRPLADLTDLWRADPQKPMLAKWSDFWFVELEQVMLPLREPQKGEEIPSRRLFAVPGYMDFGMFCVNLSVLAEWPAELLPDAVKKWWPSLASHQNCPTVDLKAPLHATWEGLIDWLPRAWLDGNHPAAAEDQMFKNSPTSLYSYFSRLLQEKRASETARPWLFAFDSSAPETTVCTFFELAWSFGEPESFFANSANAGPPSTRPCIQALVFLQELVAEGFMPASPTLEDTERSIFSRHFYSTLTDLRTKRDEKARVSAFARAAQASTAKQKPKRPFILPLPFFPVGRVDKLALEAACEDAECRLRRLMEERLGWKFDGELGSAENGEGAPAASALAARVRQLCKQTKWVHAKFLQYRSMGNTSLSTTAGKSTEPAYMDVEDVQEVLAWQALRIRLLAAHVSGQTLSDVLKLGEGMWRLPDEIVIGAETPGAALTGYACQGSWMYAVHRSSRSVSLARDLIQELTSLDAAKRRQQEGAGIPARKDFFRLHGREPVKYVEHLTWRELLRFGCARARRRQRVLPDHVDASEIYALIHEGILFCLNAANQDRLMSMSKTHSATAATERATRLIAIIEEKITGSK